MATAPEKSGPDEGTVIVELESLAISDTDKPSSTEEWTTNVCKACEVLFNRLAVLDFDADGETVTHHSDLNSLIDSAASKCVFCSNIWELEEYISANIEDRQPIPPSSRIFAKPAILQFDQEVAPGVKGFSHFQLHAHSPAQEAKGSEFSRRLGGFRLVRYSGEAPCFWGNQVLPKVDVGYLPPWWYNNCIERHSTCAKVEDRPLPARLLDVTDGVRLINTAGRVGTYATLSHCWGDPKAMRPFETHKNDLIVRTANEGSTSLQESPQDATVLRFLELEGLPKTFQEAITVIKTLGLHYIWIDSLCIIQDSPDDWEKHCSKMDEIYEFSSITIAAADCEGPSTGFLDIAEREQEHYCTIAFPTESGMVVAELTDEEETTSRSGQFRTAGQGRGRPVLDTRGWCLQERLLSPRVLHFSAAGVTFECNTSQSFENKVYPLIYPEEIQIPSQAVAYWTIDKNILGKDLPLKDLWRNIVEEHSRRMLSYEADKLPSLSGIVAHFFNKHGGRYIAGLWEATLSRDLAWRLDHYEHKPGHPPVHSPPSWSWAACKGTVTYGRPFENGDDPQSHVIFCDASITTVGQNTFGAVKSGTLSLQGFVVDITVEIRYYRKDIHWPLMLDYTTPDGTQIKTWFFVDKEDYKADCVRKLDEKGKEYFERECALLLLQSDSRLLHETPKSGEQTKMGGAGVGARTTHRGPRNLSENRVH